jgi:probable HAF family extracellular repeat protein
VDQQQMRQVPRLRLDPSAVSESEARTAARELVSRLAEEQGKARDLGVVFGDHGQAVAVNDRGQVIGKSRAARRGGFHAFVWENGKMTDLGTLPGAKEKAVAINERGQIVGWSGADIYDAHAVPLDAETARLAASRTLGVDARATSSLGTSSVLVPKPPGNERK